LLFLGGKVLEDFAFVLFVGVITARTPRRTSPRARRGLDGLLRGRRGPAKAVAKA